MVTIEITEATMVETARRIKLSLPIFAWQILEKRANTLFGGNINKCIEHDFKECFYPWFVESMKTFTTLS